MKKFLIFASLLCLVCPLRAHARDTIVKIPLSEVLELPEAKAKITTKFYLSGQTVPASLKIFETDVTNKKTNALNKTDDFACKWVILSALLALQEQAQKRGANAVVELVSYYKKHEVKDSKTIECHVGTVIAGTALKGSYAKFEK
ncbi:MAG: excinuclease ATPase subunit [Proteobacteria bacterium]|nr:excinuclease ATPase subunit [Pseudomonadota bacterium]